jgi:hypothetical protein
MWFLAWVSSSFAGQQCDQVVEASFDAEGASALAIRGWLGNVTVVPGEGSQIVFRGVACGEVPIRLTGGAEARVARARVQPQAELVMRIEVPASVRVVTFYEHRGPMNVDGLAADLAVVSSEGPVNVRAGGSLRVAYSSGELQVDGLKGDLTVDRLVGTVDAIGLGGDARIERVTGAVHATRVAGDLVVSGGDGEVIHAEVQGLVDVPRG